MSERTEIFPPIITGKSTTCLKAIFRIISHISNDPAQHSVEIWVQLSQERCARWEALATMLNNQMTLTRANVCFFSGESCRTGYAAATPFSTPISAFPEMFHAGFIPPSHPPRRHGSARARVAAFAPAFQARYFFYDSQSAQRGSSWARPFCLARHPFA